VTCMRTSGSKPTEEGVTQVAGVGATEELHRRENDRIAVRLPWSSQSYHPHAHLAAQLHGTASTHPQEKPLPMTNAHQNPDGVSSLKREPRPVLSIRARVRRGELRAARPSADLEGCLEQHRAELTSFCARMLASPLEAEDAVQETLLRAWRSSDGFEGRASLRSWLYRIATNVCLDLLSGRQSRPFPIDLGPAQAPEAASFGFRLEGTRSEPVPDYTLAADGDPAEVVVARETIRLAFIAALQYLPARQRAVLVLSEVLRWKATEVAELLDTTVGSVNSALQRARATLAARGMRSTDPPAEMDDEQRGLLARYVQAFEAYDIDAFTSLIREDATQSMPSRVSA
jgi:RNA polymerase sigma-70 factor (TIGR02960 family)